MTQDIFFHRTFSQLSGTMQTAAVALQAASRKSRYQHRLACKAIGFHRTKQALAVSSPKQDPGRDAVVLASFLDSCATLHHLQVCITGYARWRCIARLYQMQRFMMKVIGKYSTQFSNSQAKIRNFPKNGKHDMSSPAGEMP